MGVPDEGSLDLGQIRLAASAQMAFTVRDAAGQPVEGARVALRNSSGNSWVAEPTGGTREVPGWCRSMERGGRAAENAGVVQAALNPALATGVTDEAGRCVLDLPDATEADLRITAPDFARYEEEGLALPLVGVREKTVTLSRGGGVRLLVVESTGEPSVDTPVEHHETDRTHRTDGEGRIELSRLVPGPHTSSWWSRGASRASSS